MRFLPANAQHIGSRHSQQDSFGFGDPDNRDFVAHGGFLAIVCDGMGGMEFGDAASKAATRAFLDAYQLKTPAEPIPAALQRSVRAANDGVVALARSYGLSDGMGTTLVAAAFHDTVMHYVSVGDSGLFLLRGGNLQMLNRPHVFANLLDAAVARGTLSAADAESHPERESLTSFIGAEMLDEIDASVDPIPLMPGDAVLLASDGLFKTLTHSEMVSSMNGNPLGWPEALVAQTIGKKREHQDNVTVLAVIAQSEVSPESATIRIPSNPPPPVATPVAPAPATPAAAPMMASAPPAEPAVFVPATVPPIAAPVSAPPPSAGSSPRGILFAVIGLLLLIAAGAGWYFYKHRTPATVLRPSQGETGPVAAPTTTPRAKPPEIKLDPDAPVAHPPQQIKPQKGGSQ